MNKIEQEVKKVIEEINRTNKEEWNGRFEIELIKCYDSKKLSTIVVFAMKDNLKNIVENGIEDFYKLGKTYVSFHIWNAYNKFVNKCLEA